MAQYQNGSGVAAQSAVEYDILGRARWMRDPEGTLSYAEYDIATAAMTLQIQDVDTTQLIEQPVLGWTTPSGGGQHVVSSQEVDVFGRPTKITTPGGVESYVVYNDADREVRQYAAWNNTLNKPTGLTNLTRVDRTYGYVESLQMAATPTTANGVPVGTESIGNVVALSRSYFAPNGRLGSSDSYFNLDGLAYTTSFNLGVEGTNFLRTRYDYGELGELNRVESSDGRIARSVIDGLGRTLGEWIGADDAVTGEWSPTNPGPMERISAYEYDHGGVGNGNLTALTTFTGGGDRTQAIQYDWRDRPVLMLDGVGASGDINRPLTYLTYDNANRTTNIEIFDGDTHTLAMANGVPIKPALDQRRAWSMMFHTNLGQVWKSMEFGVHQTDGTVPNPWATRETQAWYDQRGLPIKLIYPGGLVEKTHYDGLGQLTANYLIEGDLYLPVHIPANDVTNDTVWMQSDYVYDDRLDRIQVTSRERNHGTYNSGDLRDGTPHRATHVGAHYDDLGRMTASVDVGTHGGNPWTRPATVPARSDTALVTSINFDDANRAVTLTDPRGIDHRSTHDALGRMTSETAAFGTADAFTTTASYNKLGQLAGTTSPGNLTTNYGYDGLGRTTSVTDPAGLINTVSYNRIGEPITSTDPTGLVVSTSLNALGQPTSMSYANGRATRSMSATYDVLGRTLSVTDPRGNSSSMAYHDEARYVESIDAEGYSSRTDYDVAGNTIKLTNPHNQSWTATYDILNRLISTSDPLLHGVSVEHNRNGDRTRITDAVGRTQEEVLDRFGRTDSILDGYGVTVAEYGYDRNSQVNAFTDARGNLTQMSYDNLGHTTSVTEAVGTSLQRSSSMGYHVTGQFETMTDPLGNITKYGYDGAGRTVSVTAAFGQPEAMTATQSYDLPGRSQLKSLVLGLE